MSAKQGSHEVEQELARRLHRGTWDALGALDFDADGDFIRLEPHSGGYRLGSSEQFWGGFLLGRGWILADLFDDASMIAALTKRAHHLEPLMGIANVDTGFAGYYGLALGHEITGDTRLRDMALRGARSLAELYRPDLGVVLTLTPDADAKLADLAFADVFCQRELLVDTVAVLDLMWWASRFEETYLKMLVSHFDRTLELGVVEANGRCHHALSFDEKGEPERLHTHQGAGVDSPWTRAHAWAAIGYATGYAATGRSTYRDASLASAGFFLDALGDALVPKYDLALSDQPAPEDTCSTAIVLTALERLRAAGVEVPPRFHTFESMALSELLDRYVTPGGTLLHGCWGAIGAGPRESIMPYGNYFIAEATYRKLRPERTNWGIPAQILTAN